MRLAGDRRLLIVGKTGSGKSFLARYLLKQMEAAGYRVVIVDPKIDWMVEKREDGTRVQRPYSEAKGKRPGTVDNPVLIIDFKFHPEYRVMIIHPVEWSDALGDFLRDILHEGNTIIYFDEGTQLVSANFVPIDFNIIESQGRSRDVGVWYGTQRSVRIPLLVKDQASIIILMRVTSLQDRQVLGPYMNAEAYPALVEEPLPPRYFWMYDDETDQTTLYAPLHLEGKRAKKAG